MIATVNKSRRTPGNGKVPTGKRPAVKRSSVERGTSLVTAFQELRKMIVMGQLSPGSWVVEADLAKRLGLSRTPIRGALQWLQREGYVIEHREGKKGRILIAPLTKEDAHELYTIVGHLEALAGAHTASLPAEQREKLADELASLNDQMNQIATQRPTDPRRVFDLDKEFHARLVEASAGPRLLALHCSVKPQVERYWRLYASSIINELHNSVAEHNEIIQGIRKGDPQATEVALGRNWTGGLERISGLIDLFGERGSW
jgi:DNA-binding GntR family transcriptional regulator